MATGTVGDYRLDTPGYDVNEPDYSELVDKGAGELRRSLWENNDFRSVVELPWENPREFRNDVSQKVAEMYGKDIDRPNEIPYLLTFLGAAGTSAGLFYSQTEPAFGIGVTITGAALLYLGQQQGKKGHKTVDAVETKIEIERQLKDNMEYTLLEEDDYLFELDPVDLSF
jgi:hypothetical protein